VEYVDYEPNCEAILYSYLVIERKLPLKFAHNCHHIASRYRLPIGDNESIITIVNIEDDHLD